MRCKDIIEVIEETYPKSAALGFDHVGLQAGRNDKEVNTVYLALDATDKVITLALGAGADMLITHHPLIFTPLESVTDGDFVGRRVLRLLQKDISYYAMHTNYDVMGMADLAAKIMELKSPEVLDITIAGNKESSPKGIGKIGYLEAPITLRECCEYVKSKLNLSSVMVFGDPGVIVRRVAVSPGSGKSAVPLAVEKGADVLITGDIGHHTGVDAVEQGLSIIDAGHYGTEYIFIEDMKKFIHEKLPGIKVYTAPVCTPFRVI